MIDRSVEALVDRAIAGTAPSKRETVALLTTDASSPEAAYIRWGAELIGREASHDTDQIYAQIGVDANPCSKNCLFCSFAACNTTRTGTMEMPLEKIIKYARAYVEDGANCLTIMITADYDFERYLDCLSQVRQAVGPDIPITANMGDFDLPMAKHLKEAGVGSVYHAVRMGEGVVNRIPLNRRFETIEAAHRAGLKVMTCLEMIDPSHTDDEVAANMERVIACKPEMATAWGMVAVPGTRLYDDRHYTYAKYRVYCSVMRLACGLETRFGNGNLSWAEVGTNPRDGSNETEKDGRGESVQTTRENLEHEGWQTFRGPSPWW